MYLVQSVTKVCSVSKYRLYSHGTVPYPSYAKTRLNKSSTVVVEVASYVGRIGTIEQCNVYIGY